MNSGQVRELADRFGVHVMRSKHAANGVYRMDLSNGRSYALKPMAYPISQLRWIDRTLQRIRKAGFTRIAWRDPHEPEGKKLYVRRRDGKPYILSPWIEGRWPSPSSQPEMRACGALLARFHQSGAIPPGQKNSFNMLGTWPAQLRAKHVKLQQQISLANSGRRSDRVGMFLREHGDELLGYSQNAQSMLRSSQYSQACKLAERQPHICHGDGGPSNFIFGQDGPYLIDFETMRIDLRAYDLYRVIFNSCWTSDWDFATAEAILDGYQEVARLDATDLCLISAWLRFPRTTALFLQHYKSRYHSSRASIAARLPAAIGAERNVTAFLTQLGMYLS